MIRTLAAVAAVASADVEAPHWSFLRLERGGVADFRERPGCRDALLNASDDPRFRDPRYVMKTREYAFVGRGAPRWRGL